jgi:hypothetical protein
MQGDHGVDATQSAAQMLLHAQRAHLNGDLGTYTGWSPSKTLVPEAEAS